MASPFNVPWEGREDRFLQRSHRESNPGPLRGSPLHYRCAMPGVCFGEAFGPTEKWWLGTCFWSCAKTILVMTKTAILYEYSNIVIFRLTNIYNVYIYLTCKDENILTFKTVNFLSFHFKIICLLSPPSWTRAEPTEILGCSLVRPNVKVGHRPERQNAWPVDRSMTTFLVMTAKTHPSSWNLIEYIVWFYNYLLCETFLLCEQFHILYKEEKWKMSLS